MKGFSTIVLALLLVVAFSLPASASAATNPGVKPGSFFYFFDTTFEKIGLFFTFSSEGKARKALEYADERLAEAEVVTENAEAVKTAITNYESNIAFAEEKSKDIGDKEKAGALLTSIADNTSKHQEVLTDVLAKVPDEAKEAITRAIEASRKGHEEAMQKIAELKGEVEQLKQEVTELKAKDEEREKIIEELSNQKQKTTPPPAKSSTPKTSATPIPKPATIPSQTQTPVNEPQSTLPTNQLPNNTTNTTPPPTTQPTTTQPPTQPSVTPEPSPVVSPSPTQTPTPTPAPTPAPTPTSAPSAHFSKYGFDAPEIVNWTTRQESWAPNVAELKIDLVEKDMREAVVSPTLTSVSLGKFSLHLPRDTYIGSDISVSAAFWSNDLSNRNDQLYGINKNVFKRLYLKNDIYGEITFPAVLTESTDYYFKGNYYVNFFGAKLTNTIIPNTVVSKVNISGNRLVLQDTEIVFEIFLELQCTNTQCLDPDGQSINYLNNGHLQPKIGVGYKSYNYNQETNNYTSVEVQNVLLNSDGSLKELGINFFGRLLVFKATN
ncbi:MAG: hypothetical protein HYT39_00245 [Candidatus Sungbacteria bacterium]|nr:hypothetical protein [Candidatus Sungbacteria bacterium]